MLFQDILSRYFVPANSILINRLPRRITFQNFGGMKGVFPPPCENLYSWGAKFLLCYVRLSFMHRRRDTHHRNRSSLTIDQTNALCSVLILLSEIFRFLPKCGSKGRFFYSLFIYLPLPVSFTYVERRLNFSILS